MPVSYINSTSGSQTSSATSGTLTLTALSAAPTTGAWIFVAFMGNDPANVLPSAAKCGSISLNPIDVGYGFSGSRIPFLYGAPYQSGMSTAVTVTWNNSSGNSRGMYATCIVIGGAYATYNAFYSNLRTQVANGLFDSSCGPYNVGQLQSNGTSQASGATLSWSNSAGIQTSYDTQKEPFFLASWNGVSAYTAPSTLNGAATIANGVITTSSQASGTVVLASASTYGTTGTAYLLTTSGVCPFSWTGKSGNNLTGCSIYGGSASGFYNFSLANGTGASINHPVLIQTSSITAAQPINGWQMGVNATTGIGVSVATAGVAGVQAAGQLTLSFGQSSGLTSTPAYLVTSGSANPCGSVMVTLVPTTRTMTRSSKASQVLTDLASKTTNRVRQAIATHVRLARESRQVFYQVVSAAMGVLADYDLKAVNRVRQAIATMSRASSASKVLTLTKRASSALVGASQGIKTATFNRTAKATAVNSVVVTRAIVRNRTAVATATYAISSSKSRTAIRRAIATAVAYARVTPVVQRFMTHPGTVSAAVNIASVSSSVKTATVSASATTATVRSAVETATVSADVKTASVHSSVKPLV